VTGCAGVFRGVTHAACGQPAAVLVHRGHLERGLDTRLTLVSEFDSQWPDLVRDGRRARCVGCAMREVTEWAARHDDTGPLAGVVSMEGRR
jgi:hypothetical protein